MNLPSINQRVITVPLEAWLAAERLAGHANSITNEWYASYSRYAITENWREELLNRVKIFDKAKNIALVGASPEAKETVKSAQEIARGSAPIKSSEPTITLTDAE